MIDKIKTQTQLNISVDDAAIADKKIDLDQVLVTDNLKDLSARNVLSLVLDKARLKFAIENDVVRITTEEKAKGRLYTKVFSVMDLVTPVPDFALAGHQSFAKAIEKSNAPPPWAQAAASGGFVPQGGLGNGQLASGSPWAPQGVTGGGQGTLQTSPLRRLGQPGHHPAVEHERPAHEADAGDGPAVLVGRARRAGQARATTTSAAPWSSTRPPT